MNDKKTLDYWMLHLGLDDWCISLERIDRDQVTFDDDVPEIDRYFIGISPNHNTKRATLFHDMDLTEEDILHELLHIKCPKLSEDKINNITKLVL
jgi:hypothetical protein